MSTVAAFFSNYTYGVSNNDSRHFSSKFRVSICPISVGPNFGRNFSLKLILHYRIRNVSCSPSVSMDSVTGITYRYTISTK